MGVEMFRGVGKVVVGLFWVGGLACSGSLQAQLVINYANGQNRAIPEDLDGFNADLNVANGSATQSGSITGSGMIAKIGDGSLTLSAINSYAGGTFVEEGELVSLGTISHIGADLVVSRDDAESADLTLLAGSFLENRAARLGIDLNDIGRIFVDGGEWQTGDEVTVGVEGTGEIYLDLLAEVESDSLVVGQVFLSSGLVCVESGTWTVHSALVVGDAGYAELHLEDGGNLSVEDSIVGRDLNGTGIATIFGGSWVTNSTFTLGLEGTGVVELGGGTLSAPSIDVATDASAEGLLVIGYNDTAGVLDVPEVVGGPGLGQVIFDHAENDYFFTRTGTSIGAPIALTGSLRVIHEGAGTTTLTGPSTFNVGVTIENGVLVLSNSTGSATGTGPVAIQSGATLAGSGEAGGSVTLESGGAIAVPSGAELRVGSLTWDGGGRLAISLQSEPSATGRLSVQSALVAGDGGALQIELGGTASAGSTYVLAEFGTTDIPLSQFQVTGASGQLSSADGQLRFTTTGPTPPDNSSPRIRVRKSKRNPRLTFVITNPGPDSATFRLQAGTQRIGSAGSGGGDRENRRLRRIFTLNGNTVTRRISLATGPGINTPLLAAGQSARVGFRIRTVRQIFNKRRIEARIAAFNVQEPQQSATKRGQVVVRP